MRVVIYGGSGFIGSWITKFLLNNNFQITIFDRKTNKDFLNRIIGQNIEKIDFVEGDILEYETVLKTAKDHSVLINLVGLMTPDCSNNPRLGNQVNIIGSINIFEAALEAKCNLVVYTSSGGVYGQKDKINPFPETHYGAYKLAVEGIARAYNLENKLNSFGLRPFVVYGPGREIGGTALAYSKKALQGLKGKNPDQDAGVDIVRKALEAPCRQIVENAGVEGSIVIGKLSEQKDNNFAFDAQT